MPKQQQFGESKKQKQNYHRLLLEKHKSIRETWNAMKEVKNIHIYHCILLEIMDIHEVVNKWNHFL